MHRIRRGVTLAAQTRARWQPAPPGDTGLDPGALGLVLRLLYPPIGVHTGHQVAAVVRDHHVDGGVGGHNQLGHPPSERIDTVAGAGGNEHRAGQPVPQLGQHQVASDVNLVHYQQLGRRIAVMVGDHLGDHLTDRVDLG